MDVILIILFILCIILFGLYIKKTGTDCDAKIADVYMKNWLRTTNNFYYHTNILNQKYGTYKNASAAEKKILIIKALNAFDALDIIFSHNQIYPFIDPTSLSVMQNWQETMMKNLKCVACPACS